MITVTQPTDGKFRVHLPQGLADFGVMDEALDKAREAAKQLATSRAVSAGATAVEVELTEQIKLVPLASSKDMFIEATIQAAATGTRDSRGGASAKMRCCMVSQSAAKVLEWL